MNKEQIYRVLKLAAKEEAEKSQEPLKAPVVTRRYYYYNAEPENSIAFTALKDILEGNSPEKDTLIKKLQGGNSGPYMADYFLWKSIAILTNQYSTDGKEYITYTCDLSPLGAKISGSEAIEPSTGAVRPEDVETDFRLFDTKRGNDNVINIDPTGESYFIDEDAPSNISKILLSGAQPSGSILNYTNFIRKYDEYRIWVPNLNQLLLPNFEVPRTDDVPGGHYVGGETAYNKYVAPYAKNIDDEEPTEEKPEETESKPKQEIYKPVQKNVEPVKGDYIDNPHKKTAKEKKKKSEGDYASEPYSGGTDVMQRLVEDQRKCMKIRRAAKNVVAQITTTQTQQNTGLDSKKLDEISKHKKTESDLYKELSDQKKKLEDVSKQIYKSGGMISNVVELFTNNIR